MARKALPVSLDPEEKSQLLTWVRSHKIEKRYAERAGVILCWHQGRSISETADELGLTRATVIKWRKRFGEGGLASLQDRPGRGRRRHYMAEDEARVLAKAREKPPKGFTRWSQRRLAAAVGMSASKVNEILQNARLKPHKTDYWCGRSPDPEFEQKMLEIVGLYLNPPRNALVLCVDEKTNMQALDRTQPVLPLTSGKPRRLTATYKRNGTVSLLAALSVHTGEITAEPIKRNDADTFLRFLKRLYRDNPRRTIHVVCDNLSAHKDQRVKAWIASRRRIQMHFTPTYASWLNQIEIWFGMLARDVVKGGVWKSTQQMIDQIMEYVSGYNETATPFEWTYTGKPKTGLV